MIQSIYSSYILHSISSIVTHILFCSMLSVLIPLRPLGLSSALTCGLSRTHSEHPYDNRIAVIPQPSELFGFTFVLWPYRQYCAWNSSVVLHILHMLINVRNEDIKKCEDVQFCSALVITHCPTYSNETSAKSFWNVKLKTAFMAHPSVGGEKKAVIRRKKELQNHWSLLKNVLLYHITLILWICLTCFSLCFLSASFNTTASTSSPFNAETLAPHLNAAASTPSRWGDGLRFWVQGLFLIFV